MTIKLLRVLLAASAIIVVGAIIWVDVNTDLWQKYVVISGLAGGLVTFVLTALVLDRIVARSTHERWIPVTRLALGDLRRRLTADTRQDGTAMVTRLSLGSGDDDALRGLVQQAAAERDELTSALARWSAFLSASADATATMDAIADAAERLDNIDTIATDAVRDGELSDGMRVALQKEIDAYHSTGDDLLREVDTTLQAHTAERRRARSAWVVEELE